MLTPERGALTAVIVRRSQGKRQSTLILREMGWLFRSFQGLQALIQLLLDQVPRCRSSSDSTGAGTG